MVRVYNIMRKKTQKVICIILAFCCICFTACNHKPLEMALRQFREAYDAAKIIDACKEFDGTTPGLFYVTSDSVWIGFRMSHAEGDSIMVRLAR